MIQSTCGNYSGIAAAVSGINAGRMMQSASAQNIANANTDDYQAVNVELSQSETGGVSARFSQSEPVVYGPFLPDAPEFNIINNVSMIDEIMNLKTSENLVEANIAAFKIQDKALGNIIDLTR